MEMSQKEKSILTLFKELSEREENVLTMYFGLGGKPETTLEEMSKDFDLTKELNIRLSIKNYATTFFIKNT